MFTGHTLPFAEFSGRFGLDVRRGCDFAYVGKVPTRLERRIVPCTRPQHLAQALEAEGIAGVIVGADLAPEVPEGLGLAISADPVLSAMELHEHVAAIEGFQWADFDSRIDPSAQVHPSAIVAERNVVIGPRTVIGPGTVVRERSIIGADCDLGTGNVIGLDALDLFPSKERRRVLRQSGGVQIADEVTVLAKCTLVRATFGGFTRLERGVIADVLIHIAHDCVIGAGSTLVACCEISGRCELGEDCYIGPNASIRNGVRIGAGAKVSMGAVVTRDVPAGATVSGNFAVDHEKWLDFMRSIR